MVVSSEPHVQAVRQDAMPRMHDQVAAVGEPPVVHRAAARHQPVGIRDLRGRQHRRVRPPTCKTIAPCAS